MKKIDKNSEDWANSPVDLRARVGLAAAKVVKLYQMRDDIKFEVNNLPFDEDEGKLITGFIMHQKLSDLIYTIENPDRTQIVETYNNINNMNYQDYVNKYLINEDVISIENLAQLSSITAISDYLEKSDNYKIYHSLNDYLVNAKQLRKLKDMTGYKTVLFDNGAHLGFLYRQEFIEDLKKTILEN